MPQAAAHQWHLRELVNHMVIGNQLCIGILRGEKSVSSSVLDPKVEDAIGDDPAGSYRAVTEELLAAFREPGVLEQIFEVPVDAVPGIAAVHVRAVEDLTHGWDIARATGQRCRFAGDIVEREIEFCREKLADVPPDQSPFGPPQPVADDAPAIDRLAALLGRSV